MNCDRFIYSRDWVIDEGYGWYVGMLGGLEFMWDLVNAVYKL